MVKKKIIVPLLLLCSMLFAVPVMASEPKAAFVYDDAELFDQSEADSISEKISDFSSETGWEIYAFTTEDAQGYTSQEYGENTFDQYATGMDGVAFVIDMDNREIAVVHFGEANR
ncbi:MAG: TPM domain-containing protein, partial [Lachnospiraceae bacterium]|nr:TPM domain-containing protein [Lachnospiraceae bacterium]